MRAQPLLVAAALFLLAGRAWPGQPGLDAAALPADGMSWFIDRAKDLDVPPVAPAEPASLLRSIEQAQAKLADEPVGRFRKGGLGMALAVLDGSGSIHVLHADKTDAGLRVTSSDGFSGELRLRQANGINSDIACEAAGGCRVLALKYPLADGRSLVYTPYSPELALPEVTAQGLKVLRGFISEAYARLRERGVQSLSYPDHDPACAPRCLAADVVPSYISAVLVMDEHVDPSEFTSPDKARELVREPLVLLAANRERAWTLAVSKAGAHGMMQFMPATYRALVRAYPSAGLIPDFEAGTADPVNAIMAQVLLCDTNWGALRRSGAEIPETEIGPYLAAAYNGGTVRVLAILKDPQDMAWMQDPDPDQAPTQTVVRTVRRKGGRKPRQVRSVHGVLAAETVRYVAQFDWIRDYWFSYLEKNP